MLTLIAAAIGTPVGFTVVPGLRPIPLQQRVRHAITTTAAAARALARDRAREDPDVLALQREAAQAHRDLTPDHDPLTDEQLTALDRLRVGLRDFSVLATAAALDPRGDRAALERALDGLEHDPYPGAETAAGDAAAPAHGGTGVAVLLPTLAELAGQVRFAERALSDSASSDSAPSDPLAGPKRENHATDA